MAHFLLLVIPSGARRSRRISYCFPRINEDVSTSLDMTEIAARFSASEVDALFVLLQRKLEQRRDLIARDRHDLIVLFWCRLPCRDRQTRRQFLFCDADCRVPITRMQLESARRDDRESKPARASPSCASPCLLVIPRTSSTRKVWPFSSAVPASFTSNKAGSRHRFRFLQLKGRKRLWWKCRSQLFPRAARIALLDMPRPFACRGR